MATLIKIDTSPLPIKGFKDSVSVKPVGSLVDEAMDVQIDVLSLNTDENQSVLDAMKFSRKVSNEVADFLRKVLGLTKKQYEEINEKWTKNELGTYSGYVLSTLLGTSYDSYKDFANAALQGDEESEDPKKSESDAAN